ncbi:hypothetical protein CDAR_79751 [Caerostris darwini]|uniref:Uncharacterized protein n=1 Tax=Caerostris darwini TaxID=1538125 RepID=A0AAV4WAC7_9ARAC|nr:hypothetical protein CDAR_79751 [Caerostris darwini]
MSEGRESSHNKRPNSYGYHWISTGIIHEDGICDCWPQVVFSQNVKINPGDIDQLPVPLSSPVKNWPSTNVEHMDLISSCMTECFRNIERFREELARSGRRQYVSGYSKVVGQKPGFYAERAASNLYPSELKGGLNDLNPCNDTWRERLIWNPNCNIPTYCTDLFSGPGYFTEDVFRTVLHMIYLNIERWIHVLVPPGHQQEMRSRSMSNIAAQKSANNGLMEMPGNQLTSTTTQNPSNPRPLYSEVCRKEKSRTTCPKQQQKEVNTEDVQELFELTYFPPKKDVEEEYELTYWGPKRDDRH